MKVEKDGKVNFLVSMTVTSVTSADEGEYKAIASNKNGEGVATMNLNFEGQTEDEKPK